MLASSGPPLHATRGVKKIEEANEILRRTLETIDYYKPELYPVENLQMSMLKEQGFMAVLPY